MIAQSIAKAAALRVLNHRAIESLTGIEFELIGRPAKAPRPAPSEEMTRWRRIRESLSEAQNHRCCYCGKRCDADATVEHVTPRSRGGTDAQSNLVMACRRCNEARGSGDAYVFAAEKRWLSCRATIGAIWPGAGA